MTEKDEEENESKNPLNELVSKWVEDKEVRKIFTRRRTPTVEENIFLTKAIDKTFLNLNQVLKSAAEEKDYSWNLNIDSHRSIYKYKYIDVKNQEGEYEKYLCYRLDVNNLPPGVSKCSDFIQVLQNNYKFGVPALELFVDYDESEQLEISHSGQNLLISIHKLKHVLEQDYSPHKRVMGFSVKGALQEDQFLPSPQGNLVLSILSFPLVFRSWIDSATKTELSSGLGENSVLPDGYGLIILPCATEENLSKKQHVVFSGVIPVFSPQNTLEVDGIDPSKFFQFNERTGVPNHIHIALQMLEEAIKAIEPS
eukprot:snap_masked-scaffold_17-processed-gene-2.30-mRNA-1 protein AED:1.00 eAED:1.00 QI:0/0/0/0/1/1/2/0/310